MTQHLACWPVAEQVLMKLSTLVTAVAAGIMISNARAASTSCKLTNGAVQANGSENIGGAALGLAEETIGADVGGSWRGRGSRTGLRGGRSAGGRAGHAGASVGWGTGGGSNDGCGERKDDGEVLHLEGLMGVAGGL
jgi:hypothetical protein